MDSHHLRIRHLGLQPYQKVWQAMSRFTSERDDSTMDELWVVEHYPVYTQGRAGKPEHILQESDIPIVQSDRGGQVTYHGPGQLILYPLINLRRYHLGVRDMVTLLEQLVIQWLDNYHIQSYAKAKAPGVYVGLKGSDAKIASLGLRIRRGCSFHGLSLNLDMDLAPFQNINPCGYEGMAITQFSEQYAIRNHCPYPEREVIVRELIELFTQKLNVSELVYSSELPLFSE